MQIKLSSINSISLVGSCLLLTGCPSTPNDISFTSNQGQCVQLSQYSTNSNGTNPQASILAAFPQIESNPESAPYCTSFTLQNNNSGTNANTVQITTSGLVVSYTVGNTNYSSLMYDPSAATISITGNQTLGNLAIFDPNNCATTQGANVQNLAVNGGSCTFYMQLLSESNPVGVYSTNLTYNYTNGNQNYAVSNNINQRVYLYGGAPDGLYFVSNDVIEASQGTSSGVTVSWSTGITGAPNTSVSYIIEAPYGFVYFATGPQVYVYNGISATQVGADIPGGVVTSIALDTANNVYASTLNGIYVYNTNGWTLMQDTNNFITANSSIINLRGSMFSTSPNYLYATNSVSAYQCTDPDAATATFSCAPSITTGSQRPAEFYNNAIDVDPSGNLYAGALFNIAGSDQISVSQMQNLSWGTTYDVSPTDITSNTAAVGGAIWESSLTGSNANVYFTLYNNNSTLAQLESAAYQCNTNTQICIPLLSSGSNTIYGNANTINADGLGNLYIAGSQLNSVDWGSAATNVQGVFLLLNPTTILDGGIGTWTPIYAGSLNTAPINYVAVSSMLTTY